MTTPNATAVSGPTFLETAGSATVTAGTGMLRGLELYCVPVAFSSAQTVFKIAQHERQNAIALQNKDQSQEAFYANCKAAGWTVLAGLYGATGVLLAYDFVSAFNDSTVAEDRVCPTVPSCKYNQEAILDAAFKGNNSEAYAAGHIAGSTESCSQLQVLIDATLNI